ncbi:TRAP transporter substrate-binding protein [Salinicola sp. LHM]|jgi:TRAP-type C4-dicarboxylate transport system substrate-binding protein|uniref:TRAP transporter substrate-binding protein n=1 Tax=unclassified Salinicola TaxID=2634022 RepID=UPI002ACE809A|nr:TRAP transporter substrate-binding protein [Salinicola sp. LHM]MED5501780.1 TRAP transporter substrate-binding protein [Pseudomonadota bacterium]WQH32601.1 TRAP transporter substrate-binding protein [Salinicola sp. LHM]
MNRIFARTILALSVAGAAAAAHADTTLRMSHFWPSGSAINQQIFEKWAKAVEEESGGSLKVQNFPSQTLSQADETYDAAVNGIADIGITAQGYTNGRFPLSQVVELPGVAESAPQGACVLQTLYDDGRLSDEYDDSHVLFMFTTGPGYLHTKDTDIQKPSDLEGLRMRRPTAVAGDIMKNMGAQPVGMPAPDIYTSLQRGVIDGLSIPWEGVKSFQLGEQLNYHTQVPFYTLIFVATMNKNTYESLSPEQKKAIDDNSGMKWAENAGQVFAAEDEAGRKNAVEKGDTINVIDNPLENPDWQKPLKDGIEIYLSDLESRGLDQARDVYQAAMDAAQSCKQ